jgi:hypothetical protein
MRVTAARLAVALHSNGMRRPDAKAAKDLRNVTHTHIFLICSYGTILFFFFRNQAELTQCALLVLLRYLQLQAFVTPAHFCLRRTKQACELRNLQINLKFDVRGAH